MPEKRFLILMELSFCLLLWGGGGCAHLGDADSEASSSLPVPVSSRDSVSLEIVFLRLPVSETENLASVWQQVDEQTIPSNLRRRLSNNGLRSGIVSTQLPDTLRHIVDLRHGLQDDKEAALESAADAAGSNRTIQLRAGQRGEIVAGNEREEIHLLTYEEGRLQGETFNNAQCLIAIRPLPQGDGRVVLTLTPEIHYGQMKQRYIGHASAFRIESARERRVFDEFQTEYTLSPGESILFACSPESKGIGRQFFSDYDHPEEERKFLLVRLAQTQYDDRFHSTEPAFHDTDEE